VLVAAVVEKVVTNSSRDRVCRKDKEPRQAERAAPVVRARVIRVVANNNSRRNSSNKHRDRVSAVAGADVTASAAAVSTATAAAATAAASAAAAAARAAATGRTQRQKTEAYPNAIPLKEPEIPV
jgi:hypothetical protein